MLGPSCLVLLAFQLCPDSIQRPVDVVKAFLDSMNDIVYLDDTQVVELHSTKVYGDPYVEVLIQEVE